MTEPARIADSVRVEFSWPIPSTWDQTVADHFRDRLVRYVDKAAKALNFDVSTRQIDGPGCADA